MCTVLLLLRPGDAWPVIAGMNRDERLDRAFAPPARHWPEHPRVVAGLDRVAGGSWFGVNDDGVVAAIVNGMDRLGPVAGKASRGELVLRALDEPSAARAADVIALLPAARYRGFTLIVADRERAFAIENDERRVKKLELAAGHHMVTPDGIDDPRSPRVAAHDAAFRDAPPPDPRGDDWAAWEALLRRVDDDDPHRAMTVVTPHDFGTVCSALVAVPLECHGAPRMRFANGPPTRAPYEPLRGEACTSHA